MKIVIHIYPQRVEAVRAIEKVDHPRADKHHAVMFIDYPTERHIYFAGTQDRQIRKHLPDKFIIHDKDRCYGPVLDAVREVSFFNDIEVQHLSN